jgi:3-dehydroquinate dehydratase/shikimate dehydrogenase
LRSGGAKVIGKSKICAVVAADRAGAMWKDLAEALPLAKVVELRLDWLADDKEIERFLSKLAAMLRGRAARATLIATCRRREGGGRFRGTIAKQLVYLAEALRAGCTWYDLEIESASRCPSELLDVLLGEGRRIVSAHFFRKQPRNLKRVAAGLSRTQPDAVKIAAQCESLRDARKVLALARGRSDVIAVPMGDTALPARVLALSEGSALAYAPVGNATAPGQVSLDEMQTMYRAERISRQTRVYGVIGNPIAHSLSPQLHNAGFRARAMDAVYLPFVVRDLRDFLEAIAPLRIRGFSVTLPHKEAILRYLDGCDELAVSIGAVNTVSVGGKGKLYGRNTDYVGVLRALERRMPLAGSRVLILGAGGVARAVAFALSRGGASVGVCARRPERALALARAAGGEVIARRYLRREFFDAIVNATPVGMHPGVDRSPLAANELNCRLVFDTIYRPRATKLMQLAARRGIETVSGVEMFLAQGTAQWEIWTGRRAPEKPMRDAVLAALKDEETKR